MKCGNCCSTIHCRNVLVNFNWPCPIVVIQLRTEKFSLKSFWKNLRERGQGRRAFFHCSLQVVQVQRKEKHEWVWLFGLIAFSIVFSFLTCRIVSKLETKSNKIAFDWHWHCQVFCCDAVKLFGFFLFCFLVQIEFQLFISQLWERNLSNILLN